MYIQHNTVMESQLSPLTLQALLDPPDLWLDSKVMDLAEVGFNVCFSVTCLDAHEFQNVSTSQGY